MEIVFKTAVTLTLGLTVRVSTKPPCTRRSLTYCRPGTKLKQINMKVRRCSANMECNKLTNIKLKRLQNYVMLKDMASTRGETPIFVLGKEEELR